MFGRCSYEGRLIIPSPRDLDHELLQTLLSILSQIVCIMEYVSSFIKCSPFLIACAWASASLPPIPKDLTTPVQQRLSINGADSE